MPPTPTQIAIRALWHDLLDLTAVDPTVGDAALGYAVSIRRLLDAHHEGGMGLMDREGAGHALNPARTALERAGVAIRFVPSVLRPEDFVWCFLTVGPMVGPSLRPAE